MVISLVGKAVYDWEPLVTECGVAGDQRKDATRPTDAARFAEDLAHVSDVVVELARIS